MSRSILSILALLCALPASAFRQEIRDVDIHVMLTDDGAAKIEEVWDVTVATGNTEWYLVRENLGDIELGDLSVSENGREFRTLSHWDIDRSIYEKAQTCGFHKTNAGYEICWGVGSDGAHRFTVSYTMSNAVKSLNDSDILHLQLISDDLGCPVQHARVTISAEDTALNSDNTRIWGFGFDGNASFAGGGAVVYETEGAIPTNGSVIVLLCFQPGMFSPTSYQNRNFEDVFNTAMHGASYEREGGSGELKELLLGMLVLGLFVVMMFVAPLVSSLKSSGKIKDKRLLKRIFGTKDVEEVSWCRDLPFGGDIFETYFVASHPKGGYDGSTGFIQAFMLRMVQHGILLPGTDSKDKMQMQIDENAARAWMSDVEEKFFSYLLEAAGNDKVLQAKEFKKWAYSNADKLSTLLTSVKSEADKRLKENGYSAAGSSFKRPAMSDAGKPKALEALGFKKYLEDFTIINQRRTVEVHLWNEYLVNAALFGIADKVAAELKELDPGAFSEIMPSYGGTDVIVFSNTFNRNINDSIRVAQQAARAKAFDGSLGKGAYGGFGGHTSFGGGGGFSGGGHGGGGR